MGITKIEVERYRQKAIQHEKDVDTILAQYPWPVQEYCREWRLDLYPLGFIITLAKRADLLFRRGVNEYQAASTRNGTRHR